MFGPHEKAREIEFLNDVIRKQNERSEIQRSNLVDLTEMLAEVRTQNYFLDQLKRKLEAFLEENENKSFKPIDKCKDGNCSFCEMKKALKECK